MSLLTDEIDRALGVLKMKPARLAREAGVSQATISMVRSDQRPPGPKLCERLERVLGLERGLLWDLRMRDEGGTASRGSDDRRPASQQGSPPDAVVGVEASLYTSPDNLPEPPTSFIGRETELEVVREQLRSFRLVTFTGAGGCGKTRLALRAASRGLAEGMWPEGVALASLDELAPEAAPAAEHSTAGRPPGQHFGEGDAVERVARLLLIALGAADRAGCPPLRRLVERIADADMLLVLDNCEHVVGACACVAECLLSSCRRLRILATSRERLNVGGEAPYRVPSLSYRAPGCPQGWADPASLSSYDAARLFIERASAASQGLSVGEGEILAAARICARLDGMPLAIELAAAQTAFLSVRTIADLLDKSFDLLDNGVRTRCRRQRTLRATIDWSCGLLTEDERLLLQRLSVFHGGWTLEAAQEVCGQEPARASRDVDRAASCDEASDASALAVVGGLKHLTAKSLVVRDLTGPVWRYKMQDDIRATAYGSLEASGAVDAVQARHLAHYRDAARSLVDGLSGAEAARCRALLNAEMANFRAAMDWGHRHPQHVADALHVATALYRFWHKCHNADEGRAWLQRLLDAARVVSEGDPAAMDLAADPDLIERGVFSVAVMEYKSGNYGAAEGALREWVSLHEAPDACSRYPNYHQLRGRIACRRGDLVAAREHLQECLRLSRALDDPAGEATALSKLAEVEYYAARYACSLELVQQAASIERRLGRITDGLVVTLNLLGRIAWRSGDFREAARHCAEAVAIAARLGVKRSIADALDVLAAVAASEGRHAKALWRSRTAVRLRWAAGDLRGLAESLDALAALLADAGCCEPAAVLMGAADALHGRVGAPRPPSDHPSYAKALEQMQASEPGEDALDALWAQGSAMSPEDIVRCVARLRPPQAHARGG